MTPEQKKALALARVKRRRAEKEKSWGQIIKDNLLGDDDPTTQNFGEKLGTFLNKGGEALTAGVVGDEAAAAVDRALGRGSYDERLQHYRGQEENLAKSNPLASVGADIGGAALGALLPGGAMARGASIASRVGRSALAGGAYGATYGAMEGEGLEDRRNGALMGGALGAGVGAVAPVIGSAGQKALDGRAARRAIARAAKNAPSTDALRAAGQAAYKEIDEAGLQIKPEAFDRARGGIMDALRSRGLDELPGPGSLTPKAARAMEIGKQMSDDLAGDDTAALPFQSLDMWRRQMGNAAKAADPADSALGAEAITQLDDFVRKMGADDIASGDLRAVQTAIPKARELWAKMSKSQIIDDAIDAGQDYPSGGASGIRNQFRRILRNKNLSRGFSEAEIAAMRRVVNGTLPEQTLNLLGGGLGQLTQIGAGFGVGGLPGAILGGATAGVTRKGSETLVQKNAETVRALVANGGLERLPVSKDATRAAIERMIRRAPVAPAQ